MWIRLIDKLPTQISPPAHSIHWAGAKAEVEERLLEQEQKLENGNLFDMGDCYFDEASPFPCKEAKEEGSVWIIFDGEALKVFPHEYREVQDMDLYLMGEDPTESMVSASHFPMYGRKAILADPRTLKWTEDYNSYPRFDQEIFEASLIDGMNDVGAFYTAIKQSESLPRDLWFAMNDGYLDYLGVREQDREPSYKKNNVFEKIKSGWED